MKKRTFEEQYERMGVIFNVQEMGKRIGTIYTDGTIDAMTLEELRQTQDKLIPLYNESLIK